MWLCYNPCKKKSESFSSQFVPDENYNMKIQTLSEPNFDLWLLFREISHSIIFAGKRELGSDDPSIRKLQILRAIQSLGSNATISEVANILQREIHVISRYNIIMEKDVLIKRFRSTPKSTPLKLEPKEKALDILKLSRPRKTTEAIFSFMFEKERQRLESILNRILIEVKQNTS